MAINNNIMTFTGALKIKRGTATNLATYTPAAGELVGATDTGVIKMGNGSDVWPDLPAAEATQIANNYTETTAGKALDAVKGKDLNDRLADFEGITGIDCGVISGE